MSYVTLAGLQNRFGADAILRLTDRDGDKQPDTAFIQNVADGVDGLINGYLSSGGYDVSGNNVPDLIKKLAYDIAFYELHSSNPTKTAKERYDNAIATLKDIAAGRHKIDLPAKMESVKEVAGEHSAEIISTGRRDFGTRR